MGTVVFPNKTLYDYGYVGIVEKNMVTTILGLYRDSGKENGNYWGYIGVERRWKLP